MAARAPLIEVSYWLGGQTKSPCCGRGGIRFRECSPTHLSPRLGDYPRRRFMDLECGLATECFAFRECVVAKRLRESERWIVRNAK